MLNEDHSGEWRGIESLSPNTSLTFFISMFFEIWCISSCVARRSSSQTKNPTVCLSLGSNLLCRGLIFLKWYC